MRRLQGTLGQGFEVLTAGEAAEQVGEPVRDFLGFFTFALLGFAAVGVVVGAFVIFNTFTILVTQRTRELGLLRAMGASGGQVVGSVILEALLVGVAASLIGLAFGVLLGVGLLELLPRARAEPARDVHCGPGSYRDRLARGRGSSSPWPRRCFPPFAPRACRRWQRSTT